MKKMFAFLRSMTFGMILLCGVLLCSFAGSMIPQQQTAMHYVNLYGERPAMAILALGLDDVFSQPYFIALMAALCLNLLLCSVLRVRSLRGASERLRRRALEAKAVSISAEQAQALRAHFTGRRWRQAQEEGRTVFSAHMIGHYGSFLTHLSLLMLLVVGGLVLAGAEVIDRTVMPGSFIELDDGARVSVQDFRIEDETGRLDFMSTVQITAPDGRQSAWTPIRVNEPLRFGAYKVYQQTYGTAGKVLIENLENGAAEEIFLTESCFLTLNGVDGLFYQALYPGYVQEEDGTVTLITSSSYAYHDPVYDVLSVAEGTMTPVLAFPEDELTLGNVRFTFMEPAAYPGLRIKTIHSELLYALYAVFALMVIGLALCFFAVPTAITVTEQGYALHSSKPQTGLMIDIEACLTQEEN